MDEYKKNKSQGATEHQDQAGCQSQTERSAQADCTLLASFKEDAFLSRALERVLAELGSELVSMGGALCREVASLPGRWQGSESNEGLERSAAKIVVSEKAIIGHSLDNETARQQDSSPRQEQIGGQDGKQIIVGLSGGADSAMLLVYARLLAPKYHLKITALHIHHGLQKPADEWAAHSQALCEMLGVDVIIKRVAVDETSGLGMEASARQARYLAYKEVASELNCAHFLLAHHQNDQAETVLLRLLRGTGAQGMGAMSAESEYDDVHYYRPWLDVPRARILAAAQEWGQVTGWYPVNDPTNHDVAYTRAAVRELLVPALDARWPSWQNNVIRHAQLMQENNLLLKDLAAMDLTGLELSEDGRSFSLAAWRDLAEHRQANVLRYWLSLQDVLMPSQARMNEWMRQLRSVHQMGTDRKVEFMHQGRVIRLVLGRVKIE